MSGVPVIIAVDVGKICNQGNLQHTAQRCQINAPFQLLVDDIKLRLWICKEKCEYSKSMENNIDSRSQPMS
jgi:hypothetical protein